MVCFVKMPVIGTPTGTRIGPPPVPFASLSEVELCDAGVTQCVSLDLQR